MHCIWPSWVIYSASKPGFFFQLHEYLLIAIYLPKKPQKSLSFRGMRIKIMIRKHAIPVFKSIKMDNKYMYQPLQRLLCLFVRNYNVELMLS